MPEKVIHEIRLNQYIACPADRIRRFSLGTRDSYGVEQLRIVPGEGWDGLMITATFHPPEGEAVQVLVPADGLIDVPPEATRSGSELPFRYGKIVFAGVADGVQRISCNLPYTVMDHAPVDGAASSGPSPSWYEQAAAHFLPSGGKAGQVLAKASDADLDVEWADGADYVLTDADKSEIAEMAAELVEVPDSGENANNGITTGIARSLLNLFANVSHYDKDISEYYQTLVNELGMYNITYDLVDVTSSNTNADIMANLSFQTTLTPKNGYIFDSVVVTMGGVDITDSVFNSGTGIINIGSVTGNVVITANAILEDVLYNWDFTQSLVDTVEGKEVTLMTGSTQESDGIHNGRVKIFDVMAYNRTIEIDFVSADYNLWEVNAVLCGFALETAGSPMECLIYRKTGYWYAFNNSTNTYFEGGTHSDANMISGKTLKLTIDADGIMSAYVDNELIAKYTSAIDATHTLMILGSQQHGYADFVVSGMRVYEGVR